MSISNMEPLHVTMRLVPGLPSLRNRRTFAALYERLHAAKGCNGLRVLEFSVQSNHLHLLVEADGPGSLARGMIGLGMRLARCVNRLLGRRGQVFGERFHARVLRTPRQVRRVLVYILGNAVRQRVLPSGPDPFSSAPWFRGWSRAPESAAPAARGRLIAFLRSYPTPTASPSSWIACSGWRSLGRIRPDERPAAAG